MEGGNAKLAWSIRIIGSAFTLFQLYLAGSSLVLQTFEQRVIHLGFVLLLMFLMYDFKGNIKNRVHAFDVVLLAASVVTMGYILLNWEAVAWAGMPEWYELVLGAIAMVLVIEAARRAFGLVIPIMTVIFILFAFAGPYLPEPFTHRGFGVSDIVSISYLFPEGIFGVPIGVMVSVVFLFVTFGIVSMRVGASNLINDSALAIFGSSRGGPAKMAVVGSCAFGTISGSGVANVVVTGTYTIPLMKGLGFKPHVAGAIEAVASTGGTFMPPVMAACGFIMATNLSVPYWSVCAAALIPALLYYLSAFIFVDMEAAKSGIQGVSREERPSLLATIKRWSYPVPGIMLMIIMLAYQYNESRSALYGIGLMVIGFVLSEFFIYKDHAKIRKLFTLKTLEDCGRSVAAISAATACIGIIIGIINLTGFGGKLSGTLILMAGGSKVMLLILTMIASLILGMGITPTGVYILLAGAVVPGLIMAGFDRFAAHFYVLYFGCLGAITPPVALSCYAAAPIANADPMRIGWTAWRIAAPAFIIPFAFAFEPALVAQGPMWLRIALGFSSAFGVFAMVSSLQGYIYLWGKTSLFIRVLLFLSGIALISPELWSSIGGAIVVGLIFVRGAFSARRRRSADATKTA